MDLDSTIEELTKLLIKQDLKDKDNGKKEILIVSKVEAIKRTIKILKSLKK